MSVVIDASVLVAALVDSGQHGQWAEAVVTCGSIQAPEVARADAANTLRRLERARQLTTAEANAAFEYLTRLEMELYPFDPFADRVWSYGTT